jgi:hypothetical protein
VSLVTSLLTAIVRADGDALVLHAGERPYVVTPGGRSELASRALTLDAVKGMLNELLPAEAHQALAELGAVQHDLATPAFAKGESFNVVAARGGEDIWIEIRRHRKIEAVPVVAAEPEPQPVQHPEPQPEPQPAVEPAPQPEPAFASIDLNVALNAPIRASSRSRSPATWRSACARTTSSTSSSTGT